MANNQLNIIVAGKSGVGKSSFLNYLIDSYKFETGNGEPVTQHYFQQETYTASNDVTYNLYDTKGLEPGECENSKKIIIDEIEKRDQSDDMFSWIHSVYYCISAVSRRLEPFEVKLIKDLKEKCSIVVLLTKADKVGDADMDSMKQEIYNQLSDDIQVIPVCSVVERTRKGISNQFGKEDVLRASFLGLWDKLALTLPSKLTGMLDGSFIEQFGKNSQKETQVDSFGIGTFGGLLKKIFSIFTGNNKIPKNHVDVLCFMSSMSWNVKDLNQSDRNAIYDKIDDVNKSISYLKDSIQTLNVDKIWKEQENIIKQVFQFYDKVNKNNDKKVLFLHRAKSRLNDIKRIDMSAKIESIHSDESNLRKRMQDVADCLIFDSDEKKSVIPAWNSYRDNVVQLGYELKELLFKFEATFEAELYQYGQYCIREN